MIIVKGIDMYKDGYIKFMINQDYRNSQPIFCYVYFDITECHDDYYDYDYICGNVITPFNQLNRNRKVMKDRIFSKSELYNHILNMF